MVRFDIASWILDNHKLGLISNPTSRRGYTATVHAIVHSTTPLAGQMPDLTCTKPAMMVLHARTNSNLRLACSAPHCQLDANELQEGPQGDAVAIQRAVVGRQHLLDLGVAHLLADVLHTIYVRRAEQSMSHRVHCKLHIHATIISRQGDGRVGSD